MASGSVIKLEGENEYRQALKEITTGLKLVSSELKLTSAEFTSGDKTLKQTKSSYDTMNKSLDTQKDAVAKLKEELVKAEKEYGSNNVKVQEFKTKLNQAELQLKEMEDATDKSTDELKDMKNGFEDASDGALKFGDVLKANVIGDFIVDGLKKVGSAVVEIGKQAIAGFGEFEQLEGGVKKLFGDDMATVIKNANNAYKTAGMTTNAYMETVTSFSASLISSLKGNTKEATSYADMAIRDMSDNANTFGTDISMIQSAYQGFAKQNYTMLDNLKLGYGGTKTEMERLLKDAEKISGKKFDLSNFADITEAIHIMQEEMKIAGTTSAEASGTIEGSISSMKSAWENWVSGLANENADMTQLTNNLITAVTDVVNNLKPVIAQVVSSIGEVIGQALQDNLPQGVFDILKNGFQWIIDNKDLLIAGITGIAVALGTLNVVNMITEIVNAFKAWKLANEGVTIAQMLLNTVMSLNPIGLIIAGVAGLVAGLVALWHTNEGFREAVVTAWTKIKEVFSTVWGAITTFFTETLPQVWANVVTFFEGIPEWFSGVWQNVLNTFTTWGDNIANFFTVTIPSLWQSIIDWFNSLPEKIGYALGFAIGKIIQWGVDTWNYLVTNVPIWIESVSTFFSELPGKIWTWLLDVINKVTTWGSNVKAKASETGRNFINNVINYISQLPGKAWNWFTQVVQRVIEFGENMAQKGKQGATDLFNNIVNTIKNLPNKMLEMGKNIVQGLWNGISNMASWIYDKISGFCSGVVDGVRSALGIHSPSKVFEEQIGKNMALGLGLGFSKSMNSVTKDMQRAIPTEFDTNATINGIEPNTSIADSNYYNMVNAFKEALTKVKVVMDDREMGTFVTDTMEKVVYS